MNVRRTQNGRVSLVGIDPTTLAFLLKHAKESLQRDRPTSLAIQGVNGDLLDLCDNLLEFLSQEGPDTKTIDEPV